MPVWIFVLYSYLSQNVRIINYFWTLQGAERLKSKLVTLSGFDPGCESDLCARVVSNIVIQHFKIGAHFKKCI